MVDDAHVDPAHGGFVDVGNENGVVREVLENGDALLDHFAGDRIAEFGAQLGGIRGVCQGDFADGQKHQCLWGSAMRGHPALDQRHSCGWLTRPAVTGLNSI
jgi:hypothetical protein